MEYELVATGNLNPLGPNTLLLTSNFGFEVYGWGEAGSGRVNLGFADFLASAERGVIDWSVSIRQRASERINISAYLIAQAEGGLCGFVFTGSMCSVIFNSLNTTYLTGITLPSAYALVSESGELVAYQGGFNYRAAIAEMQPPAAVPEPTALAMLGCTALLLAGLRVPGRRARTFRSPAQR